MENKNIEKLIEKLIEELIREWYIINFSKEKLLSIISKNYEEEADYEAEY